MVGHGRARLSGSSDPKPREGTETGRRIAPGAGGAAVVRPKTPRGDGNAYRPPHHSHATAPCPQTQNPERGRKHFERELVHSPPFRSSDPKPREGTETRNPAPHPQLRHAPEVVRPKTPRGDGNSITLFLSVARLRVSSDPKPREGTETPRGWRMRCARKCRQTQNPERGRKLVRHLCLIQVQCPVVRPKTPRGDGNLTARSFPASIR
ncbi:Uncharacterised protein [Mycobacterium tuberculosis]|nr:Uncharacterised protein [Mycobacterium tuberculosis]